MLEKDEGLRYVVLDFDMPNTSTSATVKQLRSVRPDVVIVGNSGANHRDDFSATGVEHFLTKPWRAAGLIDLLGE